MNIKDIEREFEEMTSNPIGDFTMNIVIGDEGEQEDRTVVLKNTEMYEPIKQFLTTSLQEVSKEYLKRGYESAMREVNDRLNSLQEASFKVKIDSQFNLPPQEVINESKSFVDGCNYCLQEIKELMNGICEK